MSGEGSSAPLQLGQSLAEDLEHWLAGEPIRARPATAAEHLWRWCRRQPALAGLVFAVALCSSWSPSARWCRRIVSRPRAAPNKANARAPCWPTASWAAPTRNSPRPSTSSSRNWPKTSSAPATLGRHRLSRRQRPTRPSNHIATSAWSRLCCTAISRSPSLPRSAPRTRPLCRVQRGWAAAAHAPGECLLHRNENFSASGTRKRANRSPPPMEHDASILMAGFSPDGHRVATAPPIGPRAFGMRSPACRSPRRWSTPPPCQSSALAGRLAPLDHHRRTQSPRLGRRNRQAG